MNVLFWLAVWFVGSIIVAFPLGYLIGRLGKGSPLAQEDAFFVAPEHTKL